MDTKKILFLAILLVALGAVYFASERLASKKTERTEVSLAAGFDAAKAEAITIKSPGKDGVTLKKKNGAWTVTSGNKSYDADAAAIEGLLAQIETMKSGTMVSKNPGNFDAFEVSEGKALDVKIQNSAGGVLARLMLGKNGPDIFSTYVRSHDGQTVYLVPGFMKNSADRELNAWRDKALFKLDFDQIKMYTVSGDRDLQFRKTPAGAWQDICDGRVSDSADPAARQIIRGFTTLAAADFTDSSMAEAKLDKPVRTITALLNNGLQRRLFLGGDKNAFQQYAKTDGQEQIYVVEKAMLDSLAPTCQALKESMKAPDPDKEQAAGKPRGA